MINGFNDKVLNQLEVYGMKYLYKRRLLLFTTQSDHWADTVQKMMHKWLPKKVRNWMIQGDHCLLKADLHKVTHEFIVAARR